ncbi:sensor histidine kinase [Paenibacillus sp. MER TA 81-3]|uniref:cache domain-containing sensor histidine kinase n=1 Tax=Paenibacillus sp. MER TA 81-3 TaxID=2939573 RepID=UPI00203CC2A0|nr:sensor histidine kinase [Paenibacillus sp. MER TA 81-3]MCM3341437.1 sensor histidine kinase [Paenibacillus sp. MER TA 81-3]
MKWRQVRSIQFIIAASFTLITVIVMLFVSFVVYDKFANTAEQNAVLNNQQIIDQVKFNLESYVSGIGAFFEIIDDRLNRSGGLPVKELQEQLDTIRMTRDDVVSMAIFTIDGQLIQSIPSQIQRRNTSLTEQSWFTAAVQAPEQLSYSPPHIQNLFEGAYKWVVSLSKGMTYHRSGIGEKGILLIDVNFKTIDDLCQRVTLGGKGYVYLIDSMGNLVYHPQQQLIYNGLKYENVEQVLKYTYGSYIDRSGGVERLITVKTVSPLGWKVVGVSYMDELVTTQQEIGGFLFWLLAAVLGFVLIVSFVLSARISHPIKRLERTMRLVEKGVFSVHMEMSGAEEVKQLTSRFNLMVARIHQLMDQIIVEQETKRKNELDILQAQIHPHFLYNTLNSVVRLAGSGRTDDVVTMISSLSKFFRISLSKGQHIISVQEELEHVKHYLIIQNIRFKHQFSYEIEAEEGILNSRTLKLILQPIVENAIQHGIEGSADEGCIRISAREVDGKLRFKVSDNGAGIPPPRLEAIQAGRVESRQGSGVGLRNVKERLQLYYGLAYGLEIESQPDVGTAVTMWLPLEREDES